MDNAIDCIILDATGGCGREIMLNPNKGLEFPVDFTITKSYAEDNSRFIIEFIASTEDLDSQNHIVTGSAMKGAVGDLIGRTLIFNHDLNRGIGKILDATTKKVDGKWCILVKAFISSVEQEIRRKIEEGTYDSFSIKAIIPENGRNRVWDEASQKFITVITKMLLVEASLVTIPANANARLIKWHIEKALNSYISKGYNDNILDIGGNMNFANETIEEIKKHLDTTSQEEVQKEETVAKAEAVEEFEVEKAEQSKLADAIAAILKERDAMKMKRMLEDLARGLKEGKYPYPSPKAAKEKDKYPEAEAMKSEAPDTNPDFAELLKNIDPELLKAFASVNQPDEDEEVEKAGKKFSQKNQALLSKISEAIAIMRSSLEELIGKTEHKQEVKKIQDQFETMHKYLEDVTESKDKKNLDTVEKLASHALALSKENATLNQTVQEMVTKMNTVLEGTPAARLEDGTIVKGSDAIRALEVKEGERIEGNAIDILIKSAKYQEADVGTRRQMMEDVMETMFELKGDIL